MVVSIQMPLCHLFEYLNAFIFGFANLYLNKWICFCNYLKFEWQDFVTQSSKPFSNCGNLSGLPFRNSLGYDVKSFTCFANTKLFFLIYNESIFPEHAQCIHNFFVIRASIIDLWPFQITVICSFQKMLKYLYWFFTKNYKCFFYLILFLDKNNTIDYIQTVNNIHHKNIYIYIKISGPESILRYYKRRFTVDLFTLPIII